MEKKPIAAGKSSFDLVDAEKLLAELAPVVGAVMLDLACGRGIYSLALSRRFPGAKIHALDLWEEGIAALRADLARQGAANIDARVADVSKELPLPSGSVDLCLAATVLHDLVEDGTEAGTLQEVRRVLKPGGTFAVVEFKKIAGPPGPPVEIRLSPHQLECLVTPFGFTPTRSTEIGSVTYLSLFRCSA